LYSEILGKESGTKQGQSLNPYSLHPVPIQPEIKFRPVQRGTAGMAGNLAGTGLSDLHLGLTAGMRYTDYSDRYRNEIDNY
jgi:hypothetical protein